MKPEKPRTTDCPVFNAHIRFIKTEMQNEPKKNKKRAKSIPSRSVSFLRENSLFFFNKNGVVR